MIEERTRIDFHALGVRVEKSVRELDHRFECELNLSVDARRHIHNRQDTVSP